MKEYKIINCDTSKVYHVFKEHDFSSIEQLLKEYNQQGWEVVSVCPNNVIDNCHGELLITFEREIF